MILLTALLVIASIFLFAFVWMNEDGSSVVDDGEGDAYHLPRRYAPPAIAQEDKKGNGRWWPEEGVDVLFFWTRPTDEARLDDYYEHFKRAMGNSKVVPEEMSGQSAQWQYYFARGLEHFAPWFSRLIVVLPDSVTVRPFNGSDPRVNYIFHHEFFSQESLPIFDWRSIALGFLSKDNNPENMGKSLDKNTKNDTRSPLDFLSSNFLFADDLSFLISYLPPSSLKSPHGELILQTTNTSISTPLQDVEELILKNSAKTVRSCIESVSDRLGFSESDNIQSILDRLDNQMPQFEYRGITMHDRRVWKDLMAICGNSISKASLLPFRTQSSLDPTYMHHVFIYYMRELYRLPSAVKKYVSKADENRDGILTREELIILGKSLYMDQQGLGNWVSSIFELKEFVGKKDIDLKILLENEKMIQEMSVSAVRPQFRYTTAESYTAALELRRSIPLRLGKVMPILKQGNIAALRLGPRAMGQEGGNTKEAIENLLWNILKTKFTTLETIYKPPPSFGFHIGLAYFCLFFFGAWAFSKYMLKPSRRMND